MTKVNMNGGDNGQRANSVSGRTVNPATLKGVQTAARRRGLSVRKSGNGFEMTDVRFGKVAPRTFADLDALRADLQNRPTI